MIIIAAMGRNRVIGHGDGMPWDVPEEYQHFVNTTRGQTLIIGRRSFEIFGATFQSARCFVITRSDRKFPKAIAVSSLSDAMRRSAPFEQKTFVAGGASIYAEAIKYADSMQLSYIDGSFAGDALFPLFREVDWNITRREDRGSYEFVEYVRPKLNNHHNGLTSPDA